MWLLSCDGNLFGGKSLWLRPGSTHLLGRTSGKPAGGERIQFINHKSVSRKHLILQVDNVTPGYSAQIHMRTRIQAIDSSKSGTTINGEKFAQETRTLDGNSFVIQLGSYNLVFKLVWQPVILSLANIPKGAKQRAAVRSSLAERLEHADVKLATEYITNQTTHVIAKKRNTAAGLEALVQAKWLVTDAWIDALAQACSPVKMVDGTDTAYSPLESDFEANWPCEELFIVPAGGEPIMRPDDLMKPDPKRADVFAGYTFVFLSQSQYTLLLPVITSAGGKALYYEFDPGVTPLKEVVTYVRRLASAKGSIPALQSSSSNDTPIVVRIGEKDEGRSEDLLRHIDISLNQRSIEQNEFLDAIVANDARPLRRSLQEETQVALPDENDMAKSWRQSTILAPGGSPCQIQAVTRSTPGTNSEKGTVESIEHENPTKVEGRRRKRRAVIQSRFQGFDDFDPSHVIRLSASPEPQQTSATNDVETPSDIVVAPLSTARGSKRPAPHVDLEEETKRALDSLLPGAAAMKRRKAEKQIVEAEQIHMFTKPAPSEHPAPKSSSTRGQKEISSDAVKARIKARVDREEEMRRLDEESIREALDVDLNSLGDVAKIEIFDLPVRPLPKPRDVSGGPRHGPGWKSAWIGRPNFKKFRPQGHRRDSTLELPRVTVTLEEVPSRKSGFTDACWPDASLSSKTTGAHRSAGNSIEASQSNPGGNSNADHSTQHHDDTSEGPGHSWTRVQVAHAEDAEPSSLDESTIAESRRSNRSMHQAEAAPPALAAERINSRKRSATSQTLPTIPAKKARQTRAPMGDASDEDDPLKFRRKRR